jgi:hypothetical protein
MTFGDSDWLNAAIAITKIALGHTERSYTRHRSPRGQRLVDQILSQRPNALDGLTAPRWRAGLIRLTVDSSRAGLPQAGPKTALGDRPICRPDLQSCMMTL